MLILRSSSTFTVPKGVKKIDVFCVGGGASGQKGSIFGGFTNSSGFYCFSDAYGAGGGGGYTATKLGVDVNPGDAIAVTVGSGGISGTNIVGTVHGGSSSVGSICSANGGASDGSGGSGGGSGNIWYDPEGPTGGSGFSIWGSDGYSDGNPINEHKIYFDPTNSFIRLKGQGTTTRYFGESTGTLYAGGGAGGGRPSASAFDKVNAGGSGGGGSFENYGAISNNGGTNTGGGGAGSIMMRTPSSGGSGICIIRWGK